MKLTKTMTFPAHTELFPTLIEKNFYHAVGESQGALSEDIQITGSKVEVTRVFPAISELSLYTGSKLEITEIYDWTNPVNCHIDIKVKDIPLTFTGTITVLDANYAIELHWDCEYHVNIPFFGEVAEKKALPKLNEVLAGWESVADKFFD